MAITALILALIVSPAAPNDVPAIGFALFASAWAMASKYMLATGQRHVFNPAALGVALAGLVLHRPVSWWVGDYVLLLPVVVLGGILILQRLKYYDLLLSFAAVTILATLVSNWSHGLAAAANAAYLTAVHSTFLFFAFVMLTEPRTAPLGRWRHIAYGGLVGLLFAPTSHVGTYYFTPEVGAAGRQRLHVPLQQTPAAALDPHPDKEDADTEIIRARLTSRRAKKRLSVRERAP